MSTIATSTITPLDLLNLSHDIAQLNLGYLGISVAILGGLGAVFIYFNIKPLKESLDKQEASIEKLRTEARDLIETSRIVTNDLLEKFRLTQNKYIATALDQQQDTFVLEMTSKIQESEKTLTEKIGSVSEEKDTKLKELIFSEITNRIAVVEKSFKSETSELKEIFASKIKRTDEKIKELQVYRYSKEGQMGAIIYGTELLKDAIDESSLKFKETGVRDLYNWKIKMRLEDLIKHTANYSLDEEDVAKIEEQLLRIEQISEFKELITKLRSEVAVK